MDMVETYNSYVFDINTRKPFTVYNLQLSYLLNSKPFPWLIDRSQLETHSDMLLNYSSYIPRGREWQEWFITSSSAATKEKGCARARERLGSEWATTK